MEPIWEPLDAFMDTIALDNHEYNKKIKLSFEDRKPDF
jgi:hypothetical protein